MSPFATNPYMFQIQKAALADRPPFADDELLVQGGCYPGNYIEVIEDVKISQIAGICNANNLGENYTAGMTFMQVLMDCLSGPNTARATRHSSGRRCYTGLSGRIRMVHIGLEQKVNLIGNNCVVAWAGSRISASLSYWRGH